MITQTHQNTVARFRVFYSYKDQNGELHPLNESPVIANSHQQAREALTIRLRSTAKAQNWLGFAVLRVQKRPDREQPIQTRKGLEFKYRP